MARSNVKFPEELVTEILLRLPVKSIIRFKCAAKSWYHLFKNPSFVSQHLSLTKKNRDSNLSLVVRYTGVVDNIEKRKIGMLALSDDQTLVSFHDLHQELPSHVADKQNILIAVSDGLVCLCDYWDWDITLWNPATKEFRILPHCPAHFPLDEDDVLMPHIITFGSGMDPLSNDYKVLYMRDNDDGCGARNQFAIYRMSSDSWRFLTGEDVKMVESLLFDSNNPSVCVNGVCYWQVCSVRSLGQNELVLTFHLSTEVFQFLRSPVPGIFGQLIPLHDGRIAFWDSSHICLGAGHCTVWLLNDEENWTKLINIDPVPDVLRMYGFRTHGKVFVEDTDVPLRLYDLETREYSELGFVGRFASVYPYKESLIAVNRE